MSSRSLILLDRDGVLNRVLIDPEHGTIDSPLHPDRVEVFPWVPEALVRLQALGYGLVIITNQPAASKGKTTRTNLDATHQKVIQMVESRGAKILSSHICYHTNEEGCACRKPKPGMLEEAFLNHPTFDRSASWMVGDGVTDVQAGIAAHVKTAFLGPQKCDSCKIIEDLGLSPNYWGPSLDKFVDYLEREKR